ncbi:ketopantoate reductase family protein [Flaviflexus sp.]|uniref:ketopantoate reductase family protein n=1 Tax=Flaviflexus sp. TaxID=1969482 RepID=UPI003F8DFC57
MLSVYGPGGVGGVLAAVVRHAGIDVEIVATERTAATINEVGLNLESAQYGSIQVDVPARTEPTPGSAIIVATKAYSLPEIAQNIEESAPSEIVSLCNGVSHAERIHDLGASRATCGAIRIVSERTSPGVFLHHSKFTMIDVEEAARGWEIPETLERAGLTVRVGGTEAEVLWNKLRFLAPMALLTASTGKLLGPAMVQSEPLIEEVAQIATASGLETAPDDIYNFLNKIDPDSDSSLGRDVTAGNPTEIDALGHDLVRTAERAGIDTPALAAAIQAIESRLA